MGARRNRPNKFGVSRETRMNFSKEDLQERFKQFDYNANDLRRAGNWVEATDSLDQRLCECLTQWGCVEKFVSDRPTLYRLSMKGRRLRHLNGTYRDTLHEDVYPQHSVWDDSLLFSRY